MKQTILVTGGLGYIGSHTVVELLNNNYKVVVVDDLSNSKLEVINRIKQITGKGFVFYQLDVGDEDKLSKVFVDHQIDAVIHFAAYKAVGESVAQPLKYYGNNLGCTISLLHVMQQYDVHNIVFSSSATVYGETNVSPYQESGSSLWATSPYGWTKFMIEQILEDCYRVDSRMSVAILRYFNPIGAHQSGLIGEDPHGVPNNLMPYITQVAIGKREFLQVFGGDYPTHDGTGVRDYIHVLDLAIGHVNALAYLFSQEHKLVKVNLGTGVGYSVLDVVKAFNTASGKDIVYKIVDRRAGDIPLFFADPSLAKHLFGWSTKYNLDDMCRDSWNWQENNPNGYE